jgi:hypothetical protein
VGDHNHPHAHVMFTSGRPVPPPSAKSAARPQ